MKTDGKYRTAGVLAGFCNGLFGAGGGLFLVPLFTGWLRLSPKKALATSVGVVFVLSLVSAAAYLWRGALDLSGAWPYLLGGAAGGVVSGKVFGRVPAGLLQKAFGLMLLYGGLRALFAP